MLDAVNKMKKNTKTAEAMLGTGFVVVLIVLRSFQVIDNTVFASILIAGLIIDWVKVSLENKKLRNQIKSSNHKTSND